MICAIITPVGPGHADLFRTNCAPSVDQAKGWNLGPFTEVRHMMMDDTEGRHGRSARRNEAIRAAQAQGIDWVFFLDADDVMTPNAFEAFGRVIADEPDLDVVWGLICTFDDGDEPSLREEQAERLDTRVDFLSVPPFSAVQIGGFYRTDAVAQFGFDEAMDTGEDYKLYSQLWKNCRCAKRAEIFFVNRRGQHSTGPRSATGADWNIATTQMWGDQLREVEVWADVGPDGARMRVLDPMDLAQMTHLQGSFFETDTLEKLRDLISAPTPHIVEIGANTGNRVVWYARHMDAGRIYPVEPDADMLSVLNQNIDANDIRAQIDTRGMGHDPDAAVRSLDTLMGDEPVDLIKIGAVGQELDVLEGAEAVIAREKPVIWIEVARQNMLGFAQNWCRKAGYRIVDSRVDVDTIDYFAIPKE